MVSLTGGAMKATHSILVILLALSFAGTAFGQSSPPNKAPAAWGPVSINLDEIEYPFPVSYMNLDRKSTRLNSSHW